MVQINTVTQAIRNVGSLECADVAQILSTLAAKMRDSGFSDVDLQVIDEAADFVCGEMA